MPKQQQSCFYCNSPATLLCDFHLGWAIGERVRDKDGSTWNAVDTSKPPYTCDLPMCRDHAKNRGSMHVRLSQKGNGRRGFFDTIDWCLEHVGQSDVGAPRIVQNEAERLRYVVRENARRRVERQNGSTWSPPLTEQSELF